MAKPADASISMKRSNDKHKAGCLLGVGISNGSFSTNQLSLNRLGDRFKLNQFEQSQTDLKPVKEAQA